MVSPTRLAILSFCINKPLPFGEPLPNYVFRIYCIVKL